MSFDQRHYAKPLNWGDSDFTPYQDWVPAADEPRAQGNTSNGGSPSDRRSPGRVARVAPCTGAHEPSYAERCRSAGRRRTGPLVAAVPAATGRGPGGGDRGTVRAALYRVAGAAWAVLAGRPRG